MNAGNLNLRVVETRTEFEGALQEAQSGVENAKLREYTTGPMLYLNIVRIGIRQTFDITRNELAFCYKGRLRFKPFPSGRD